MLFALLYALLRRVIGSGRPSGDRELEIEVVVLRHQVKVLSRTVGRPRLRRIDKAFLAACSRVLPRQRWGSFIVAPSTLLRWHRELVRRKWTYKQKRLGRPPIDPALRELICRMARENPRWGYMRIKGECRKLGVSVAATTVKKILRAAGLEPAPAGTARTGTSSCVLRRRRSGHVTSSPSRPRSCARSTCSSSSRSGPGASTSPPRPATLQGSSSPNRRGTSRWMVSSKGWRS